MNLIKLIRSISFLSSLIVIIFLTINNQKQSTKLKILIWDTPVLSLGTYIAISSGTGFLVSYFMTNVIAYKNSSKVNKVINYKFNNEVEEYNEGKDTNNYVAYDNTLIERDIKDPLPTINASFRVISRSSRNKEVSRNNKKQDWEASDYSNDSYNKYHERQEDYVDNNKKKLYIEDWFDFTHENW